MRDDVSPSATAATSAVKKLLEKQKEGKKMRSLGTVRSPARPSWLCSSWMSDHDITRPSDSFSWRGVTFPGRSGAVPFVFTYVIRIKPRFLVLPHK